MNMNQLRITQKRNNDVQETPQPSPPWISLTTLSPSPTARATSPAAARTTPLRWQLAAREQAVPGDALPSGPSFVRPGIVPMTPEPVILSSKAKMLGMNRAEGQLPLIQGAICHGAPMLCTSAKYGRIRIAVTIQTA